MPATRRMINKASLAVTDELLFTSAACNGKPVSNAIPTICLATNNASAAEPPPQFPLFEAVSVYVPAGTFAIEYVPLALDVAVKAVPDAGVSITDTAPIAFAAVLAYATVLETVALPAAADVVKFHI